MPSDYQWMFAEPETTTRREVFRWWEARRGNYNLLLLCVGVVTWILVLVAGSQAVKPRSASMAAERQSHGEHDVGFG
jgi:hypothetical protein